ncbi:hypothetical protein IF655_05565 [Streptomyces sp. DSM 110735]|uniref:Rv1733c family protein n=1 Tax=Streptomyces sp. DSM 110735 TaxID=2775031 RepID=UPI0018F6D0C0|nr:hypothetical protein [Streptomyces sp. DSM 110735]MBJ7902762.1 hypothetical protein [Streptomyces sp. DSM 110735]
MTRIPWTPPVTRVRLWRWRRNPLRRRSDLAEGWIILLTWIFAVLGGALAGWAAGQTVDASLAARRAQVHTVSAVLTADAARTVSEGSGYEGDHVWATVRWTDPDGSVHTGRTKVRPGTSAGTATTVWTDGTGRTVPPPASVAEAALQTVLTGLLVAQVSGTAVWAGGRLLRGSLVRRQLSEWDKEWKRVGPEWRKLSGGRG